jgi:hypothetical protein
MSDTLMRFGRKIDATVARIYRATVFQRQPKDATMESTLTNLFHRASAVIYFIYALWGIASTIYGLPTLISANGEQWQAMFSLVVALVSAPAAFGAAFWPAFARLELVAGSSFVALIAVYVFLSIFFAPTFASFVLLLSILVIPAARVYIIIKFLLDQADAAKSVTEE